MRRRRRPWLAALASLLMLGLGDVYNGKVASGVALAVAGTAMGWGALAAVALSGSLVPFAVAIVAAVGLSMFAMRRAFRDARALGDAAEPRRSWWHGAAFVVVALIVDVPIADAVKANGIRAWRVPSQSMFPTLALGDHVFSEQWAYGPLARWLGRALEPATGDVIVFVFPKDRSKEFLKRVVATGGQTVELHGSTLLVDGVQRNEPYARYIGRGNDFGPVTVPADHVFALGDNRDESYDSRFWGPVPIADVRGRVGSIYWSWGDGWTVRWERIGRRVE